ncbi:MAG: hypothetical protein ACI4QT_08160 [Kiritimatiellia bacterium]
MKTKKRSTLVALFMAMGVLDMVSAADVKWTGEAGVREDGTYGWADPANWGGTLPGEADTAWIQNVENAPDPMLISLDGETVTVGTLKYASTPKAILTNGCVRLAQGHIFGNSTDYGIYADIEQLVDGDWYNDDNYGRCISLFGNLSGPGVVTSAGNVNRNLRLTGSRVSVPKLIHRSNSLNVKPGTKFFGTVLEINGSYSDGNYNGSSVNFQLSDDADLSAEDAVVFNDGASLVFAGSGGAFNYYRPIPAVDQRFSMALKSGKAAIKISGGTVDGNYLTVTNFTRELGTALSVDGTGLRLPTLQNDGTTGYVGPWLWNNMQLPMAIADEDGTLSAAAESALTAFPAGGGSPAALMRTVNDLEYTLERDTSLFWLWDTFAEEKTFHLGDFDLHVYGPLAFRWGGGRKKLFEASGAGKMVFHGDEIVIMTGGDQRIELAAPIAWDATSSQQVYPSLVLSLGNKNAGDGIVLSGRDEIGHYQNINSALCARKLVFDGSSDRFIHGTMYDTLHIEQRGEGTLTFEPTSGLQTRWFALTATNGKIVMKSNNINVQTTVTTNGVFELAEGCSMTATPKISAGGVYQGFGTTSWGVRDGRFLAGGVIAPGNETKAGTLTMGGMKPEGDFTLVCRIDAETNGKIAFTKNSKLTLLTTAMTGTIRVDDLTEKGRRIRPEDEFVVIDFINGSVENAATHGVTWQVTTGTPKHLDVSNAVVTLDTAGKCLTVSGIKTLYNGSLMVFR